MPHVSFKIIPGVDQNRTPALNEAALSTTNLVRFVPDRQGLGLVQKLGGWTTFYPNTLPATVRALWAWEDTNENIYLAAGCQSLTSNYQASLNIINAGNGTDITPRTITSNVAVDVSSTSGSNIFNVGDTLVTPTSLYSVQITTHISIAGVILFGLYQCTAVGSNLFSVDGQNILGRPEYATSTIANGGSVASFATTSGDATVTVTLNDHGFSVGSTYTILIPTTVGGITLFSNYTIQTVPSANTFTIQAQNQASATTSASINGGDANFVYFLGIGAAPVGTGYGVGGYGSGGYGTGTGINPTTGTSIPASDWVLDNWGEILISNPRSERTVPLTVTGLSTSAGTVTLSFATNYTATVGAAIVVSGMDPSGYNGSYVITASTTNSVSFTSATTGAMVTGGTIQVYVNGYSPLFYWSPPAGQPIAQIIPNSPVVNEGFFVAMPQRQIIAWGSSFSGDQDPLLVRWCDAGNFTSWIGTSANQAGSYRIPKGSRIIGALQGPQQGLVWTDLALWSMQYISQPYIYAFNEVGAGCGLIAKKAAVSMNGVVYWMGQSQFYRLAGSGVEPIMCAIWDVIFQNMDTAYKDRIQVAANSRFGEISWFFPTQGSGGVINFYAKYNAGLNQWDFGSMGRTAWINESVLGPPIGAGEDLYIYQHETSTDAAGQAMTSSFQTGYFVMSEADIKMFVDELWPDMKWGYYGAAQSATVQITFYVTDFPGQTPYVYGPYSLTQAATVIAPRFRGRLVSMKIESTDIGSFWRIGNIRYRVQPDGRY